ncbi:hypothetical protein GC170_19630 [bacterium]|nr:hypothetical protein [bacterium]
MRNGILTIDPQESDDRRRNPRRSGDSVSGGRVPSKLVARDHGAISEWGGTTRPVRLERSGGLSPDFPIGMIKDIRRH